MNQTEVKEVLDKVVGAVFGYQNPLTIEEARNKFAFDLRLPQQVYDATTNKPTWAESVNPSRFIEMEQSHKYHPRGGKEGEEWILPKAQLNSIEDILMAWNETNLTTTERMIDSEKVSESDGVYNSENVYRSFDVHRSKNVIFSEGAYDSEFLVASSRSQTSSFCIRVEDSQLCSNSFNVIWSAKVTNSMFIQDCYDVMDCLFCSHMSGKQYCIANMQFEKEEYERLKLEVIKWIFTS